MAPLHAVLGEIYKERLRNYVYSRTSLDGHAAEFWRWLHEAIRLVLLQADLGSQAHCYVTGGLDALKNARQFLGYADTYIYLEGPPK